MSGKRVLSHSRKKLFKGHTPAWMLPRINRQQEARERQERSGANFMVGGKQVHLYVMFRCLAHGINVLTLPALISILRCRERTALAQKKPCSKSRSTSLNSTSKTSSGTHMVSRPTPSALSSPQAKSNLSYRAQIEIFLASRRHFYLEARRR